MTALRERVRRAMQMGELPLEAPDRTWGGPGTGASCAICQVPVSPDEIELEAELDGDPCAEPLHLHPQCFRAWQAEWRDLATAADSQAPDPLAYGK